MPKPNEDSDHKPAKYFTLMEGDPLNGLTKGKEARFSDAESEAFHQLVSKLKDKSDSVPPNIATNYHLAKIRSMHPRKREHMLNKRKDTNRLALFKEYQEK